MKEIKVYKVRYNWTSSCDCGQSGRSSRHIHQWKSEIEFESKDFDRAVKIARRRIRLNLKRWSDFKTEYEIISIKCVGKGPIKSRASLKAESKVHA